MTEVWDGMVYGLQDVLLGSTEVVVQVGVGGAGAGKACFSPTSHGADLLLQGTAAPYMHAVCPTS